MSVHQVHYRALCSHTPVIRHATQTQTQADNEAPHVRDRSEWACPGLSHTFIQTQALAHLMKAKTVLQTGVCAGLDHNAQQLTFSSYF